MQDANQVPEESPMKIETQTRVQRASKAGKTYLLYGLKLWQGTNAALMAGTSCAIASATHSSAIMTPEQAGWAAAGVAVLASLHKSLGEWVTELREHISTL